MNYRAVGLINKTKNMKKLIVIIVLSFLICSPVMASVESDINAERVKARLPKLQVYSGLQQSSTDKVLDMIANKYFAHVSPNGRGFSSFITAKGIKWSMAGEILARNYSGQELIKAWIASPTHKEVILDNYTKVGCYSKNGLTACHFIR